MKTIAGRFLAAIILCTAFVFGHAQNCLVTEHRTTKINGDDDRLGVTKTAVVKYSYDRFGRLDTMINENGQVSYWRYINDTIQQQSASPVSKTVNTYFLNRKGKAEQLETITDVFANDTSEVRISSNMSVSNYMYDRDGYLETIIAWGNRDNLNTKTVYKWSNGNKTAEEVVDNKGKVSERRVYEYYEDKPYQNLYPVAVNVGDTPKNMIKSSSYQLNGVTLMTLSFFYEYSATGLISKLTTVSSVDNRKTVTEFTYDCR